MPNIFKQIKESFALKQKAGMWPRQLVQTNAWKKDPELCLRLEKSQSELHSMKKQVSFSKEAMIEEIERFFPEWSGYELFDDIDVADIQWHFFSWEGKIKLSALLEQAPALFISKWEETSFGAENQNAALALLAWNLFSLGKATPPTDVVSDEAFDQLSPYAALWAHHTKEYNANRKDLVGDEDVSGLELLYAYYVGQYDPSNTALPSQIDAVLAGVPVLDVIGEPSLIPA